MSQTSPTYKTMEKSSTFSPELEGQSRTQMAQGSTAPVYRYIQETLHSTRHPEQSSAGDVGMRQGRPTRRSRLSVDIDRSSNGSSTLFSPSVRNRDMYINRAAVPSSELSLSDVFESVDLDNDRRIRVKEDLPVALRVLGLEWLPTYTNALLQGGTEALERVIRARKVDQASSDHTAQYSSCYQGYASLRRQVSENNAVNMQEKSGDTNVANTDTGLKQSEKPPPPPNARALSPSQSDSNVLDHLEPSKISFSTFCSIVHVLQRNNSSKKMKSVSVLSDKHRIPKNFTSRKEERSSNTHRNHHHTGAESMSSDPGLRKSNSQDRLACSGNIAHVRVEPIDSSDATGTYAGASSDSISEEAGKDSSRKCPLGEVFLGGACNPTSWRKDIAIPMLEQAGITYYNPQVREDSFVCVFVWFHCLE